MVTPVNAKDVYKKLTELREMLLVQNTHDVYGNTLWYDKIPGYQSPVIDKDLNLVSRWGLRWWICCLIRPIAKFFGCDSLSYVRADLVAEGVLNYFREHQAVISDRESCIRYIEKEILTPLDKKTRGVYHQTFNHVKEELTEFFSNPVSTRPSESRAVQNSDCSVCLWPPCLDDLGITQEEQRVINEYCRTQLSRVQNSKDRASSIQEVEISLEKGLFLRLFYSETEILKDVMLITNKQIAEGGVRKVFLCYNLTAGKYFIKKESPREEERSLLKLLERESIRGLKPVFEIYQSSDEEPWQILERHAAGTLATLFNKKPLRHFTQQISLVGDLILGLAFIHGQTKDIQIKESDGERTIKKKIRAGLFHGDITPRNILIEQEKNVWKAHLIDFDATGRFNACSGSPAFRSPEAVRFYMEALPQNDGQFVKAVEEIAAFNFQYAQKKDIWALGLVLLTILCGRKWNGCPNPQLDDAFKKRIKRLDIPPLPCLENCFCLQDPSPYEDKHVASLTQEVISQDLSLLKQQHLELYGQNNQQALQLWEIVEGMLKINPLERISAQRASELYQNFYPI